MKLMEILKTKKYKTDKHSNHTYVQDFYEDNFLKYQQLNLNFLEIGVWNGESMKLWSDYFINAKNIIGIDMFTRTSIDEVKNNLSNYNVSLFKMNTVEDNDDIFNQFTSLYPDKFDIIIDDGSHNPSHQIKTFERFSKLMNTGGLYIIEDIANGEVDTIQNNIPNINVVVNPINNDKFAYMYF